MLAPMLSGQTPTPPGWTAPTPPPLPDGPLIGPERPVLEGFLAWQRHELLTACAGLTAEQLVVRAVPPSTLSLLGLVRHLAKVERIWFRQRAAAEPVPMLFDPALGKDADFDLTDPAQAEHDFAVYAKECRLADAAAAQLDLDDAFDLRGEAHSLRFVHVHLVAEYARHLGHADLLRERILAGAA